MPVARCPLPVACCPLPVACCPLAVVCCPLTVAWRVWAFARALLGFAVPNVANEAGEETAYGTSLCSYRREMLLVEVTKLARRDEMGLCLIERASPLTQQLPPFSERETTLSFGDVGDDGAR